MTDLFRDIDEDLRAEQARLLLRRYGWVAALALLLVVAGVAAWQLAAWRERQADAKLSGQYLRAMRAADDLSQSGFGGNSPQLAASRDAVLRRLAPLETARVAPGIRTLARLRAAGLLADAGNAAGAVRLLDAVAADGRAERPLRDAATLFSVEHQLAARGTGASPSPADAGALKARLLAIDQQGGAFRSLALEAEAAIDLGRGRVDDARREIELVFADAAAPPDMRERAATLLQALGAEGATR